MPRPQPDWCADPFTHPAGFIRQPTCTAVPGFPPGMAPIMAPPYPSANLWPMELDGGEAVAQGEARSLGDAIPVYWAAAPCDPTYPHVHNGQWMIPATPSSPTATRRFHRGLWGHPAMPSVVIPSLPLSSGQHGLFVDARQAVADHLSVLRASLEWAEDAMGRPWSTTYSRSVSLLSTLRRSKTSNKKLAAGFGQQPHGPWKKGQLRRGR